MEASPLGSLLVAQALVPLANRGSHNPLAVCLVHMQLACLRLVIQVAVVIIALGSLSIAAIPLCGVEAMEASPLGSLLVAQILAHSGNMDGHNPAVVCLLQKQLSPPRCVKVAAMDLRSLHAAVALVLVVHVMEALPFFSLVAVSALDVLADRDSRNQATACLGQVQVGVLVRMSLAEVLEASNRFSETQLWGKRAPEAWE
jgi:hypothetical protein